MPASNISGSFPTLAALQSAYPSGNVGNFLVLDNNEWYTWLNNAWTTGGSFKLEVEKYQKDYGLSVKSLGASGAATTTTGSIVAGSNVVNVASVASFEVGQDIAITNAGAVNAVTYMTVTSPPTQSGNTTLTVDGVDYTSYLSVVPQIFDLTLGGTAEREFQFGISLEWLTKYITVFAGETAVQFANRIRTDPYFTDLWPTWTVGGLANTNVVRFTSRITGPRLYGAQTFGSNGMYGDFAQVQAGTGNMGSISYRLGDVLKMAGYTQWRLGDYMAVASRNTPGLASPPVYSSTTGAQVTVEQVISGQAELIATITSIDYVNKRISLSKNADYTVTNVAVRHDDTRAIQAAMDLVGNAGGGRIIVPDGTFRHMGLRLRDKTKLHGNSTWGTTLVNHHQIGSSISVQGIGGAVNSEPGFMDHWEISGMTLTTDKTTPFFTQHGLDLLFCHTVTVRDVEIKKHGYGIFEKCVWYTHYENIMITNCITGWYYPSFNPSSSPSDRFNIVIKDCSEYGMYIQGSPDVFTWVGGAVERCAKGGIAIFGGTTRSLMFEGLNLEENGGYQLEIGDVDGVAPSNITFRNCSFKNWQTAKPACAVKLNRVIGFELHNPKFFNFDIGVIAEITGSSFVMSLPSFDNCRKAYKFKDYEVNTGDFHMVVGDWNGVIGHGSTGFRQIGSNALLTNHVTISQLANLVATGSAGGGTTFVMTPEKRGFVHAAEDFGTAGTNTTNDFAKLQLAADKACQLRLPLYIPPGTYPILSPGLVFDSSKYATTGDRNIMVYGAGGNATKLAPVDYTFNAVTIQNGTSGAGSGIAPSGYIKDIYIEGPTNNATTNNAIGLLLRGMRQFEVTNVTVKKMPIGFDMIDNCYGTVYTNCRTQLGGVGLNLRHGSISGSDMNFYNCWFAGNTAAVHISPDGGGWHFFGGQLAGGPARTVDDDLSGAIIIGKDLITGAVGTVGNLIFDGIDFEGTRFMHNFRSFGQVTMTVRNCSFLQTDSSANGLLAAPLAIWKATGASQSKVIFENNGVKGYWKSVKAIDVAGQGSLIEIHERATAFESNVKFNNAAWTSGPMLLQSKCDLGHAHFRQGFNTAKYLVGPVLYEDSIAGLKRSTDWGATWINMTDGGTF
ncbi:Pectate lyase superfamily protein [compost metagenome]